MNRREAHLRQYYRAICSWLPCSFKQKRRFLHQFKQSVLTYLEEHPAADMAEIEQWAGSPQQIAASYIDSMGTKELLCDLKVHRKVVRIAAAGIALAIAIWGIALTIMVIDNHGSATGYSEVEIDQDSTREGIE